MALPHHIDIPSVAELHRVSCVLPPVSLSGNIFSVSLVTDKANQPSPFRSWSLSIYTYHTGKPDSNKIEPPGRVRKLWDCTKEDTWCKPNGIDNRLTWPINTREPVELGDVISFEAELMMSGRASAQLGLDDNLPSNEWHIANPKLPKASGWLCTTASTDSVPSNWDKSEFTEYVQSDKDRMDRMDTVFTTTSNNLVLVDDKASYTTIRCRYRVGECLYLLSDNATPCVCP